MDKIREEIAQVLLQRIRDTDDDVSVLILAEAYALIALVRPKFRSNVAAPAHVPSTEESIASLQW